MLPPRMPHTREKPTPHRTTDRIVAMIRLPPVYTDRPRLIMTHMLGVRPWFIKPTPKASTIDRPRTRPLARRANTFSSAISSSYQDIWSGI